jgi:hypothetical protein
MWRAQEDSMRRMFRSMRSWLLALGAFALLAGNDDLTEQRLKCEEAVKHLAECCPNLTASEFECGGACEASRFSAETSECLLALDCQTLRDNGDCNVMDPMGSPDAGVPSCQ